MKEKTNKTKSKRIWKNIRIILCVLVAILTLAVGCSAYALTKLGDWVITDAEECKDYHLFEKYDVSTPENAEFLFGCHRFVRDGGLECITIKVHTNRKNMSKEELSIYVNELLGISDDVNFEVECHTTDNFPEDAYYPMDYCKQWSVPNMKFKGLKVDIIVCYAQVEDSVILRITIADGDDI